MSVKPGHIFITDKVELKEILNNDGENVFLYLGSLVNNRKPDKVIHAGEHTICLPVCRYNSSTSGSFRDRDDELSAVYKALGEITNLCDSGKYVIIDRPTYEKLTDALIESPKIHKAVISTFKDLRNN